MLVAHVPYVPSLSYLLSWLAGLGPRDRVVLAMIAANLAMTAWGLATAGDRHRWVGAMLERVAERVAASVWDGGEGGDRGEGNNGDVRWLEVGRRGWDEGGVMGRRMRRGRRRMVVVRVVRPVGVGRAK